MPNMELVLALLAAATVLAGLARRAKVPYPLVLVVGGALVAAIPGAPTVRVAPDLVFLVFLPPLIYSAGLFSSPAELRDNARAILILAVGLVLATVAALAVVGHMLVGLNWPEAFVLGAILGATDPVAATAILRRVGAPRRISTLLEGEALVNDGTSLTAFKVALTAVGASSFSLGHGVLSFIAVSAGGAAIGGATGGISSLLRERIDDPELEISLGILTAYVAYIAADQAGVSGVLSAATAGLITARRSPDIFSPGTRLRSFAFWQATSFILNALLFLLIGLQLRPAIDGLRGIPATTLAGFVAAVISTAVVLRLAWMYLVPLLIPTVRKRLPGGRIGSAWREQFVLGWCGMRGALSLAAALSLPLGAHTLTTHDRGLIVFLAFATILVTLVLPGLTLTPLIRILGIGRGERAMRQETEARLRVLRAALEELDRVAEDDELHERDLALLRDAYEMRAASLENRLGALEADGSHRRLDAVRDVRTRLIDVQRQTLHAVAGERAATADVVREIERELDLEAARLSS